MDKFFLLAIVLALPPQRAAPTEQVQIEKFLAQDQSDTDNQDIPRSDEEGSEEDDSDEGIA
jgi:hypothetical protein